MAFDCASCGGVNHEDKVFQKNLGNNTTAIASAMTAYNPDSIWSEVKEWRGVQPSRRKTMNALMPKRTAVTMVIAVLAIMQGILGLLRAVGLFQFGSDVIRQGLLILPLLGVLAYARGLLVAVIALLYVAFAIGLLMRRDWAWSLGVVVAVVNLVLVLSVLIQGESLMQALFWMIVPVVMLSYLLYPTGASSAQPLSGERNS